MRVVRSILISLGAAAVGASVALLFAPQSGERTRRRIRHKAENLIQDCRENLGCKAHDAYDRGRSTAQYLGRHVRARLKGATAA